jgi:hypothetical protein
MKSSDKGVTAEFLIVTIEAAIARGTTARAVNCWRRRSLYSNACSGRASSPSRGCRMAADQARLARDGANDGGEIGINTYFSFTDEFAPSNA